MAWSDRDSWLTWVFSGSYGAIALSITVAIFLPILIHWLLYRAATKIKASSFLIIGPVGSGKTSLVTLLDSGKPSETHTTLKIQPLKLSLPSEITPDSGKYRSENDFESKNPKTFEIIDTPGHAKLRHLVFDYLNTGEKLLTGIIFVVDSADLTSPSGDGSSECLRETATYLHDTLLLLQKKYVLAKTSKAPQIHVLIAATKMDLFTALPDHIVRSTLEAEITRLRETRSRGIATIGRASKGQGLESSVPEDINDDDIDILAGNLSTKFEFALMNEFNISISVKGGSTQGEPDVSKWWKWIASQL